jgi:hypothetical protein
LRAQRSNPGFTALDCFVTAFLAMTKRQSLSVKRRR